LGRWAYDSPFHEAAKLVGSYALSLELSGFRSNNPPMATLFAAMMGLLATVVNATASAQQTSEQIKSPASTEIEKHVHNYGDVDNTCIRWTDQCRT
jgi:hypothetical protein